MTLYVVLVGSTDEGVTPFGPFDDLLKAHIFAEVTDSQVLPMFPVVGQTISVQP